jgi:hypothetical protein
MIENLASSPDRGQFSKKKYNEILENKEDHTDDSVKHAAEILDYLVSFDDMKKEREESEEFKKNNMEYDLRSTEWIVGKVKNSESYAQNLYAAMCNNTFQKMDNWCILSDQKWSCSWRYAGGIVADMKGEGDYIDYYCSGIRGEPLDEDSEKFKNLTEEQKQYRIITEQFVSECVVTDEIRTDLRKLGWVVLDDETDI